MKKCPYCAEEIQDEAIICKYCHSDLNEPVKKQEQSQNKKIRASDHDSYLAFSVIAILFSPLGVLIGIIYLCKNKPLDRKIGEHTLAVSVLVWILVGYCWYQ